jgi:soluble lytic murein transglycosylase-like protein
MGALKAVAIGLALAMAAPAGAGPVDRWQVEIDEASRRFGLPEAWIRRVIDAESGGRTRLHGRPIESSAGAMGLMQLMPGTWREMRAAHGLGGDPHDPRDNILAGTAYLRAMYDRFGYPGLFAAYNAGPARYADHLATGRVLPSETRLYVARVTGRAVASPPPMAVGEARYSAAPLFALRAPISPSPEEPGIRPARPAPELFVALAAGRASD